MMTTSSIIVPVPGNGRNAMKLCIEGVPQLKDKFYCKTMAAQSVCGIHWIKNYVGPVGNAVYTPEGDKLSSLAMSSSSSSNEEEDDYGECKWVLGPPGWDGTDETQRKMESKEGSIFVVLAKTKKEVYLVEFLKSSGAGLTLFPTPVSSHLYLTCNNKLVANYITSPGVDFSDPGIYEDDTLWIPNRWIVAVTPDEAPKSDQMEKVIPCTAIADELKKKSAFKFLSQLKVSFYPPGIVKVLKFVPAIPDRFKIGVVNIPHKNLPFAKFKLAELAEAVGVTSKDPAVMAADIPDSASGVTIVGIPCKWSCEPFLRDKTAFCKMIESVLRLDESNPAEHIMSSRDYSQILLYDGNDVLMEPDDEFNPIQITYSQPCSEVLFIKMFNWPYAIATNEIEDDDIFLNPESQDPVAATISPLPMVIQAYCVKFSCSEPSLVTKEDIQKMELHTLISTLQDLRSESEHQADGVSLTFYDHFEEAHSKFLEIRAFPGHFLKALATMEKTPRSSISDVDKVGDEEDGHGPIKYFEFTNVPFSRDELDEALKLYVLDANLESLWGLLEKYIRVFGMSNFPEKSIKTLRDKDLFEKFGQCTLLGEDTVFGRYYSTLAGLFRPTLKPLKDVDSDMTTLKNGANYQSVKASKLARAFSEMSITNNFKGIKSAMTQLIIKKAVFKEEEEEAEEKIVGKEAVVPDAPPRISDVLDRDQPIPINAPSRHLTPYEILELVGLSEGGSSHYSFMMAALRKFFQAGSFTLNNSTTSSTTTIVHSRLSGITLEFEVVPMYIEGLSATPVRYLEISVKKETHPKGIDESTPISKAHEIYESIAKTLKTTEEDDYTPHNLKVASYRSFVDVKDLIIEGYFSNDPILAVEYEERSTLSIPGIYSSLPHRSLITTLGCGAVPIDLVPKHMEWQFDEHQGISVKYDPMNGKQVLDYATMALCCVVGFIFGDSFPESRTQYANFLRQLQLEIPPIPDDMMLSCGLKVSDFFPPERKDRFNPLLLAAWICVIYRSARLCFVCGGIMYDLVGVHHPGKTTSKTICIEIEQISTNVGYMKARIISKIEQVFEDETFTVFKRCYTMGDFHRIGGGQMVDVMIDMKTPGKSSNSKMYYSVKEKDLESFSKSMLIKINGLLDALGNKCVSPTEFTLEDVFGMGFATNPSSQDTFLLCGFTDRDGDTLMVPTPCLSNIDPLLIKHRASYLPPYYPLEDVLKKTLSELITNRITHLTFLRMTEISGFRDEIMEMAYRKKRNR